MDQSNTQPTDDDMPLVNILHDRNKAGGMSAADSIVFLSGIAVGLGLGSSYPIQAFRLQNELEDPLSRASVVQIAEVLDANPGV